MFELSSFLSWTKNQPPEVALHQLALAAFKTMRCKERQDLEDADLLF